MRAREVLEDVIVKSQPGVNTSCWALFEVTCDGDLGNSIICFLFVLLGDNVKSDLMQKFVKCKPNKLVS